MVEHMANMRSSRGDTGARRIGRTDKDEQDYEEEPVQTPRSAVTLLVEVECLVRCLLMVARRDARIRRARAFDGMTRSRRDPTFDARSHKYTYES